MTGERHHRAKYPDETIEKMRSDHERGLSYGQVSQKHKVPYWTTRDILTYRTRP